MVLQRQAISPSTLAFSSSTAKQTCGFWCNTSILSRLVKVNKNAVTTVSEIKGSQVLHSIINHRDPDNGGFL